MLENFMIKPAEGILIRDPKTLKFLDKNGESKPKNSYWLRRVKDLDAIVIEKKVIIKKEDEQKETIKSQIKKGDK